MPDNTEIKDGLGNLFTLRSRDLSASQDGSLRRSMVFHTPLPIDYGGGGAFHRTTVSGVMGANAAAKIPIYAFQWGSANYYALIRRVKMSGLSNSVGFTPGVAKFDMLTLRDFGEQLVGGSAVPLGSNNAKLRTSHNSSVASIMHSDTSALTGGIYTADTGPGTTESWIIGVGDQPFTPFSTAPMKLFDRPTGEMPLLLATTEGFMIQATVPATGTWSFSITCEWEEIPLNVGY
jgi:hypothetical protein